MDSLQPAAAETPVASSCDPWDAFIKQARQLKETIHHSIHHDSEQIAAFLLDPPSCHYAYPSSLEINPSGTGHGGVQRPVVDPFGRDSPDRSGNLHPTTAKQNATLPNFLYASPHIGFTNPDMRIGRLQHMRRTCSTAKPPDGPWAMPAKARKELASLPPDIFTELLALCSDSDGSTSSDEQETQADCQGGGTRVFDSDSDDDDAESLVEQVLIAELFLGGFKQPDSSKTKQIKKKPARHKTPLQDCTSACNQQPSSSNHMKVADNAPNHIQGNLTSATNADPTAQHTFQHLKNTSHGAYSRHDGKLELRLLIDMVSVSSSTGPALALAAQSTCPQGCCGTAFSLNVKCRQLGVHGISIPVPTPTIPHQLHPGHHIPLLDTAVYRTSPPSVHMRVETNLISWLRSPPPGSPHASQIAPKHAQHAGLRSLPSSVNAPGANHPSMRPEPVIVLELWCAQQGSNTHDLIGLTTVNLGDLLQTAPTHPPSHISQNPHHTHARPPSQGSSPNVKRTELLDSKALQYHSGSHAPDTSSSSQQPASSVDGPINAHSQITIHKNDAGGDSRPGHASAGSNFPKGIKGNRVARMQALSRAGRKANRQLKGHDPRTATLADDGTNALGGCGNAADKMGGKELITGGREHNGEQDGEQDARASRAASKMATPGKETSLAISNAEEDVINADAMKFGGKPWQLLGFLDVTRALRDVVKGGEVGSVTVRCLLPGMDNTQHQPCHTQHTDTAPVTCPTPTTQTNGCGDLSLNASCTTASSPACGTCVACAHSTLHSCYSGTCCSQAVVMPCCTASHRCDQCGATPHLGPQACAAHSGQLEGKLASCAALPHSAHTCHTQSHEQNPKCEAAHYVHGAHSSQTYHTQQCNQNPKYEAAPCIVAPHAVKQVAQCRQQCVSNTQSLEMGASAQHDSRGRPLQHCLELVDQAAANRQLQLTDARFHPASSGLSHQFIHSHSQPQQSCIQSACCHGKQAVPCQLPVARHAAQGPLAHLHQCLQAVEAAAKQLPPSCSAQATMGTQAGTAAPKMVCHCFVVTMEAVLNLPDATSVAGLELGAPTGRAIRYSFPGDPEPLHTAFVPATAVAHFDASARHSIFLPYGQDLADHLWSCERQQQYKQHASGDVMPGE